VSWSPATINPSPHAGDRLVRSSVWAPRAAITGGGGELLTIQRQQVTVGLVASRIKERQAVTSDLLAAGASASASASAAEVSQALAQAKAHPDYFDPVFAVSKARYEQLKAQPGSANVYSVPGTQFELTSVRSALTQQLAAHVVGSVGPITAEQLQHLGAPYDAASVVGQAGLEQAYECRLAGSPGTSITVLDPHGATVARLASFPDHPGAALEHQPRPSRPARCRGRVGRGDPPRRARGDQGLHRSDPGRGQ
jgi:cell division protein FtsI/penicillin-binding protein 2